MDNNGNEVIEVDSVNVGDNEYVGEVDDGGGRVVVMGEGMSDGSGGEKKGETL